MSQPDKLEMHYYFSDNSHSMDAVIRNKCEAELLAITLEAAEILGIDVQVNSEVFQEGGLRDFWKFLGSNHNQISLLLVILTVIMSRVPTTDPEMEALEKEIKKLTIEEKKLNIKKLQLELKDKQLQDIDHEVIGKAALHVEKNLKVVKRRSNLYTHLSGYNKVTGIGFNALSPDFEPFVDERFVQKKNFKNFILSSNKLASEVDEEAQIEIVSPVLKEGRYKWKGIYNDKPITFDMLDSEFREEVLLEKVSFKHGSAITCVLRIARELDEVGEVKITGHSVATVIEVSDGIETLKTRQGIRHLHAKKMRDAQGSLFS